MNIIEQQEPGIYVYGKTNEGTPNDRKHSLEVNKECDSHFVKTHNKIYDISQQINVSYNTNSPTKVNPNYE